MDKFLESFSEKTPAQKIIITILGTIIFFLVIGASYLLTTPPSTKKSFQGSNISPTNSIPSQIPESNADQPQKSIWQTYKEQNYQVDYPQYLKVEPGIINGGGTSLLLSSQSNQNESPYKIEIQVFNSTNTSLATISGVFTGFGYMQSPVTVGNITARKFSGHISVSESNLQETAIIFENKEKIYKIQLMYNAPSVNRQIENIFARIVSTFKLI